MSEAGRVALEKKLRDGRTAIVTAHLDKSLGKNPVTTVTIDGEVISTGYTPYAAPRHIREAHPELVAAIGPLMLTASERDQVRAVLHELAESVPPDLDGERRELVIARDAAEQGPALVAAARMDDGGYGNPFSGDDYEAAQAGALQAQAALDAFDARYPEVAQRAAERRAAAVRHVIDEGL